VSQTGRFTECISAQDLRCNIVSGLTKARILFVLILSSLGYLLAPTAPVLADTWPIKPIKIVVPFPAGGPADSLVRPLAEVLNKKHGYTVIVENKPGANAAIASQFVAKSAPDGYTFLLGSDAGLSLAPATQKTLPYDAAKDFEAVTMVAQFSQVLTVNPNFPVKTIQDLQAVASKAPNSVSYASIGFGSQSLSLIHI
jgi:tripartite-type tricarboxylate transporter receptor subunit TctC